MLQAIIDRLAPKFGIDEATMLAKYLVQDLSEKERKDDVIVENGIKRLIDDEPLQYVTGKAYFLDYIFKVNEAVLIPRPETEELVVWARQVIKECKVESILEIGTGSGCISISLKDSSSTDVTAIDISEAALAIAKENAVKYGCDIHFLRMDFLDNNECQKLPQYDLIISNPPYITLSEQKYMMPNVLQYEPHIALFAIGDDPLIFYRQLAKYGKMNQCIVMCELNEHYPDEIFGIFENEDFLSIELRKDLQNKTRMLLAK